MTTMLNMPTASTTMLWGLPQLPPHETGFGDYSMEHACWEDWSRGNGSRMGQELRGVGWNSSRARGLERDFVRGDGIDDDG